MKTFYWILTAGLVFVLMVYNVTRDASSVCQVPHEVTYRVLR
ncbi:hypothetical protein [Pseudomonas sp. LB3P58]